MGEIIFAIWLLPYNEGVAQWVDPFYDAGADSHTSIMGSVGATTVFYNTGEFDVQGDVSDNVRFNYSAVNWDMGFNRRQENIIQYWSPNWNGFVFRFAWTAGTRDESKGPMGNEIDPVIRSSSLAYTNGPLWLAVTWQDHEDWTVASVGEMETSDAESFRVAGRYIMDLGDGMSVQISAMWEDLEYEFNGVTNVDAAMAAFGYSNFGSSYSLLDNAGEVIGATAAMQNPVDEDDIKAQKTIELVFELFGNDDNTGFATDVVTIDGVTVPTYTAPSITTTGVEDNPLTAADETVEEVSTPGNLGESVLDNAVLMAWVEALGADTSEDGMVQYQLLVDAATEAAKEAAGPGTPAANRATATAGQNVKIERDAWMISGKIKFGGPIDFRFSYMDADDLEVSCASCSGDWDETAADAWNVGVFYTMPGGTELRLTYSEVDNDRNGTYGQGISGTGLGGVGVPGGSGGEIEMFAVGIVHWFD